MPYLGKSPQHGNYSKLDDFSGDFDGSDATHAIASNGIAITPVRPEALIISINGVIQEPTTDYTVSGTNITFTTAPTAGDNFFGVAMGEQLQIGTPSDATITSAKLSGNLTTPGTLTVTNSALISGTTPTLTIGDAGAEDAKIVFDGNAQDFHIGLDDTADSLAIGLGSALGTTDHMVFDAAGHVRKPLSCSFGVRVSANVANVTGDGTRYTIALDAAEWDVNSDFDLANNKFVAPVAGTYCFQGGIAMLQVATDHTILDAFFFDGTDNWYQYNLDAGNVFNAGNNLYLPLAATIKLAAAAEVVMQLQVSNGSKVIDVFGAAYPTTWMTGFLVG